MKHTDDAATPLTIDEAGQSMAPLSMDAAYDPSFDEPTVIIDGRPLARRMRRRNLATTGALLLGAIAACLGALSSSPHARRPAVTAAGTRAPIVATPPRYVPRVADIQEVTRAPGPIRERAAFDPSSIDASPGGDTRGAVASPIPSRRGGIPADPARSSGSR